MRHVFKKIILMGLICFVWQTNGYADTQWAGLTLWDEGETAFVMPDDGETYYMSSGYTLTSNLKVRGVLEIRTGGTLTIESTTATIDGGALNITKGTLNNDVDGIIDIVNGGLLRMIGGTLDNGTNPGGSGTININNGILTIFNGTFINGNTSTGIINLYYSGILIVLGGEIDNASFGTININSGGSLYNYYGDVEVGAGTINLNVGGIFDNVRGTNPGELSISSGGNFYDATEVHLDKNLDVDYTWTITEKAIVRGYGNEIRLGTNGGIAIYGATASLMLDDVIVSGVGGNKIRTTDTNSTLSLGNVVWIQDSNTSYTLGNIFVNGEWTIAGDGTTFEYTTNQVSTVDSNSGIRLLGTTFEYNTDNANRINMVDDRAVIHLDKGTLLATQALTLANGTLVTTGSSSFSGTATLDLQNVANIHSSGATIKIGDVII